MTLGHAAQPALAMKSPLVLNPARPHEIYVLDGGSVWVSTDGSLQWTQETFPGGSAKAFAPDGDHWATVWVIGGHDPLVDIGSSTDRGANWGGATGCGGLRFHGRIKDIKLIERTGYPLRIAVSTGSSAVELARNAWASDDLGATLTNIASHGASRLGTEIPSQAPPPATSLTQRPSSGCRRTPLLADVLLRDRR